MTASHKQTTAATEAGLIKTRLDASNRIELPEHVRATLGLRAGDELLVRLEGEAIRLMTRRAGVRQAREIMRRHVKRGFSLSEELIAERRRGSDAERG